MRTNILLGMVLLLASGCAFTSAVPIAGSSYPPISVEEVTIFLYDEDLPDEFEEVAIISTNYSSGFDGVKWKCVKKRAAKLGCNGIYQRSEYKATTGERIAGTFLGTGTTDEAEFIGIRYRR